jgi:hypothetical protein
LANASDRFFGLGAGFLSGVQSQLLSRHMRRDGEPLAVLSGPTVGVTTLRLVVVGRCVARSRMNDGKITKDADLHVMSSEIPDRDWLRGLFQERGAVYQ